MLQIPPIDNNYIDEVIKSTGPYNQAITTTQGVKLRELIKKLRDYFEQQMPKKTSDLENDSHFVVNETLTVLLAEINHTITNIDTSTDANAAAIANILAGSNSDSDSLAKLYTLITNGFNEKTFATIAERDAFRVKTLPFQAFISNDGDGKWALYRATSTGINASYVKISDPDLLNAVMSSAAVKTAYESNTNTNAYTDTDKAKVTGLDAALNTKLTGALATDVETQIAASVAEDNKVISRLKLFNWWGWIKNQALTLGNKLTLAVGTTAVPSLIIPTGTLTTAPQNGAIERDANGILWSTRSNGSRYQLIEDDGSVIKLIATGGTQYSNVYYNTTNAYERVITSIPVGKITNGFFGKVSVVCNCQLETSAAGVQPVFVKLEYYLRITNGGFNGYIWGSYPEGDKLIKSFTLTVPDNTLLIMEGGNTMYAQVDNDGNNGNYCGIGIGTSFSNTRKPDNSNNQLPVNCSFSLIEKITIVFNDAANSGNANATKRIIAKTTVSYIEKIR